MRLKTTVKASGLTISSLLAPFRSGTGYIGSFTTLSLLDAGYDVVIVDSLYNSSKVAIDRIELLSGRRPDFYQIDITDEKALDEVFAKHPAIDSVIHFAALKASLPTSPWEDREELRRRKNERKKRD